MWNIVKKQDTFGAILGGGTMLGNIIQSEVCNSKYILINSQLITSLNEFFFIVE